MVQIPGFLCLKSKNYLSGKTHSLSEREETCSLSEIK